MQNEIAITVEVLLWIFGAIATAGAAAAVISRCFTPFRTLAERVSRLETEIKECRSYQKQDHKELETVELGIEKLCKCTLAITDHELTGNSVEKLREAKDEMQEYLIQR